jgi:hypothetical protein
MGLVNQTITFTAGIVPTASQWTNQFTTLYNLVNGQLDSANVDKVSSDGIMVLDTAQTRTAALTMSQAGLAFSGAISASAWTTNGVVLKTAAATYTDTSTAGSGTSATAVINSFGIPTLAATNASVTTTDAATVYIAGAPAAGTNQTLTNAYSLWVDAGAVRLDGSLTASGGGSLTGTWSDLGTVTTVDINGGTVDGAVVGGAAAAAGTFTTLAGTTSVVAASDITITSGSIISASGAITFGNENLSTTGTLASGALTVTGAGSVTTSMTAASVLATSNDSGAIGASGTAFSDLFLASGAVVNFNAGDVTITHASNSLAIEGGNVFIGDTANANMTQGLTINQGANDDEIFALKSSLVTHGVTDTTETDTYFSIRQASATNGGVQAQCFSEDEIALNLWGVHTNDNTTKTAAGTSTVRVTSLKKSGTSVGGPGANANLFSVFNGGVGTVFIVDAEGDLFADGGTSSTNMVTQYDEFEDAQLIRAFSTMGNAQNVIKDKWDNFVQYNEDTLVELGILGAPLKDKPLYNVTKLQKLQNGAIWQLYTQIMDMAERIEENVPQLRGKLIPQIGA